MFSPPPRPAAGGELLASHPWLRSPILRARGGIMKNWSRPGTGPLPQGRLNHLLALSGKLPQPARMITALRPWQQLERPKLAEAGPPHFWRRPWPLASRAVEQGMAAAHRSPAAKPPETVTPPKAGPGPTISELQRGARRSCADPTAVPGTTNHINRILARKTSSRAGYHPDAESANREEM